jgi:hypothetical protein
VTNTNFTAAAPLRQQPLPSMKESSAFSSDLATESLSFEIFASQETYSSEIGAADSFDFFFVIPSS